MKILILMLAMTMTMATVQANAFVNKSADASAPIKPSIVSADPQSSVPCLYKDVKGMNAAKEKDHKGLLPTQLAQEGFLPNSVH